MAKESSVQKVKVVCRLRPRLAHDLPGETNAVEVLDGKHVRITDPVKSLTNRFDFSACYDASSAQEEIFDNEVRSMLQQVFEGINATVFAFGCTGSGKTHTLQGTTASPGLIPQAVRTLFDYAHDIHQRHWSRVTVSMSFFEILKDKVWDLLSESSASDRTKGDLPIRENASGQVFVAHLNEASVANEAAFSVVYARACKARTTAATKLNHASSRSHAVLSLNITVASGESLRTARCTLVDLAGSENNRKTGNEANKERMKESVEINQSLLSLRKVVSALNAGESRIPYRDSKLTRILSDALGGTSSTLVICNISPGSATYRDTINTLNFGSLSRNVENRALASKDINVLHSQSEELPSAGQASRKAGRPAASAFDSTSAPRADRPFVSRLSDPSRPTRGLPIRPPAPRNSDGAASDVKALVKQSIAAEKPGLSSDELEARVDRLMEEKVERMVQERLDRLLKEKLKEAGLADDQGPEDSTDALNVKTSARRASKEKGKRKRSEEEEELARRVQNLEEQFRQESERATEHANLLSPTARSKNAEAWLALAVTYQQKGDLPKALHYYERSASFLTNKKKIRRRIEDLRECVSRNVTFDRLQSERRAASSGAPAVIDFTNESTLSKGGMKAARRVASGPTHDGDHVLMPRQQLPISIEAALQSVQLSPTRAQDRLKLERLILGVINTGNAKQIKTLSKIGAKRAADLAELVDEGGQLTSFDGLRQAGWSAAVLNSLTLVRQPATSK